MAEIIKVYRQSVEAMRFIGKRYTNSDRVEGNFGAKWGEWFSNGWFNIVEEQINEDFKTSYVDSDAHIGLMREQDGDFNTFEYWIGCLAQEGASVPEGFDYVDFPKGDLGVCWIYGTEDDVFMLEGKCGEKLAQEGYAAINDWCFERYTCPRFTTPDEKGNIILDIAFFVSPV